MMHHAIKGLSVNETSITYPVAGLMQLIQSIYLPIIVGEIDTDYITHVDTHTLK